MLRISTLTLTCIFILLFGRVATAQLPSTSATPAPAAPTPEKPEVPEKVEVKTSTPDQEIAHRLLEILRGTDWFANPQVTVHNGVVFLRGQTTKDEYKNWAADLANKTEGVVAVVNKLKITTPQIWDFTQVTDEFQNMARSFVRALPTAAVDILVLLLAWIAARATGFAVRRMTRRRAASRFLREVIARTCGLLVFLFGLYLALRLAGLSRLAVTVIGATGLVGVVLGIAFRNITENFLASLFLSFQQPFREGDLVEISGVMGFVQRLNSRTTILLTLDGAQVQVPNATVYASNIRNLTSNPVHREQCTIAIGYSDSIPFAQEVALNVLANHPAVMKDPEPWVLVDNLGSATVNLCLYFWFDLTKHNQFKVRSSVIRLTKRAFQDAGISIPDEAREVIFPKGVPVEIIRGDATRDATQPPAAAAESKPETSAPATEAEAGLRSNADEIQQRGREAWTPEQSENLLSDSDRTPTQH